MQGGPRHEAQQARPHCSARAGRGRPVEEAAAHHLGDDRLAGRSRTSAPGPRRSAMRWPSWPETRPEIVGLTADLGKYTDLHIFAQAHPDRFYQMGMAEQLLMATAAGMAREGFMPFATTYAVFASRRAYDFICLDIAEENLNVKIVCALPGLTTGYGPSHQATEDIAIFRGMPEPDHRRPLRRARDRAGGAGDRGASRAGLHAAAARQRPAACSTSTTTGSSSARRSCCATAPTCWSSRAAS